MEGEGYLDNVIGYLKAIKFPYKKEFMIKNKENWVQQQIYTLLFSRFGSIVKRESILGDRDGRIDFGVADVGIEIKIFRGMEDVKRLYYEIPHYKQHFAEIIIPYINAGGVSPDKLLYELQLLQKEFPQIKDFFELRIAKKDEVVAPAIEEHMSNIQQQTEGKGMKILRGVGKILKTMGENAARNLEEDSKNWQPPSNRDMERILGNPFGEPSSRRSKKSKNRKNRKRKRSSKRS